MQTIDAVIPLLQKDRERFTILLRSLEAFMTGLGTLYVITPDDQLACAPSLAGSRKFAIQVVGERLLVPEMESFFYLPGWYKQQLVKLAASQLVSTPFYLTLDADVICTRRVSPSDLVPNGRARCFVIERDEHPDWYAGAEAVLNMKAVRRHVLHNVTPCVWSRDGVLEVIERLNAVGNTPRYARGMRGVRQRVLFTLHRLGPYRAAPPWRGWLAASSPWAEYATYFTYLEVTGRFAHYHVESDECIYDIEKSLWKDGPSIEDIDAEPLFLGQGPPYFMVVQSNTGIPAQRIWDRLRSYIEHPSSGEWSCESHTCS